MVKILTLVLAIHLTALAALSQTGGATCSGRCNFSMSAPVVNTGISAYNIPAHGHNQALYNQNNVFDLAVASTYPDSTRGDWKYWMATVNDPDPQHSLDITLRKQAATQRISDLSYSGSGVTGPTISRFFSNMYLHVAYEENDLTGINYSSSYYGNVGNGNPGLRAIGSSFASLQCTTSGTLITGCGQSFTVTPGKTGLQNIYLYTRTDGINARVTMTVGGVPTVYNLPVSSSSVVDEEQITIPIVPTDTSTVYTVSLTAQSVQPGTATGYISLIAAALGGPTAGNVANTVLTGSPYFYGGGSPSHTYGVRTRQTDPSVRIPAATTSRTLCLSAGNPGGCLNQTLAVYLSTETDSALGGVDVHLPLGFVSNDQIVLKNRTNNNWVRVIADGAPSLTFGHRAFPADYPRGSSSPALLNWSGDTAAVIQNDYTNASMSARSAHHYAFVGMEITSISTAYTTNYGLVALDPGSAATLAAIPHDFIFQGVYAHGDSTMPNQVNGLNLSCDSMSVYDSDISNIIAPGQTQENHAILIITSRGPATFKNNHFEAVTEDFFTGGVTSQPHVTTQDIEIVNNYFTKTLTWGTVPAAGVDPKNELEIKEGSYITISGNVFFHSVAGSGQGGQSIFIRNYSYGGSQPGPTSNVDIHDNVMEHVSQGIAIEGFDAFSFGGLNAFGVMFDSAQPAHFAPIQYDVSIHNNLLRDLSWVKYGGQTRSITASFCYSISPLGVNLNIDHNTCSFDSATDNPVFDGGDLIRRDHTMYVVNRQTLDATARAINPISCDGNAPAAYASAVSTWTFNNNITSGEIGGDCTHDAEFFPATMGSFTNNSFFNITQIEQSPAFGYSPPLAGTGNTHTTSTTLPVVSGQGVDISTLPNRCAVITGNRGFTCAAEPY